MATSYPAYANSPAHSPPPPAYPPPTQYGYGASVYHLNIQDGSKASLPSKAELMYDDDVRSINRTPSPTPSENEELNRSGIFDWKAMCNWRFWIRREWFWYYVTAIILGVITGLLTIYHKQIVGFLKPMVEWMQELRFGFLIPIAVLFVISFPPLFGHEIVAVLCGVVWGIGYGFAIVAAGTFIGEVGNFYAFKYCCRARGEKLERTQISYACLAKIIRDGGFVIALVARLSAIPGHFTTAVFSTCGMGIITFSIAAVLSLPKQFVTVYLGVILEKSEEGKVDSKSKMINYAVVASTSAITVLAMIYIYWKMYKVKKDVIYARRKARQAKMSQERLASVGLYARSTSSLDSFETAESGNPSASTLTLAAPAPRKAYDAAPKLEAGGDDESEYDMPHLHKGAEMMQTPTQTHFTTIVVTRPPEDVASPPLKTPEYFRPPPGVEPPYTIGGAQYQQQQQQQQWYAPPQPPQPQGQWAVSQPPVGQGHGQEETTSSYYTAYPHSRGPTADSDGRH